MLHDRLIKKTKNKTSVTTHCVFETKRKFTLLRCDSVDFHPYLSKQMATATAIKV
jgi:late competence protein required for DNA uptake (superfamily II DNA/RNA helicase)